MGLRDHLCSRRRTIMQEPRAWSTIRRCCSTSTGCPSRGLRGWPTEGAEFTWSRPTRQPESARPAGGVFATRVKGSAVTRPRDLPYGESGLEFRCHKRRWWCREAGDWAAMTTSNIRAAGCQASKDATSTSRPRTRASRPSAHRARRRARRSRPPGTGGLRCRRRGRRRARQARAPGDDPCHQRIGLAGLFYPRRLVTTVGLEATRLPSASVAAGLLPLSRLEVVRGLAGVG
jgi:hypothetical protein